MRDLTDEKRRVHAHLEALTHPDARAADIFADDVRAEVSYPWGLVTGADALARVFAAFREAMPDLEWRPEMLIAGENHPDERASFARVTPLVGTWGHLQGTFRHALADIPPSGKTVHLRLSLVAHLDPDGRIAQAWIMPDLLDLMHQAGHWPLVPALGTPGMWPGPRLGGGVRLADTDVTGGDASLAQVLDMHHGLNTNPTLKLSTLTMEHWATNFMYYAGGGIGMCRGTEGFRAQHQLPFRTAFPDRHSRGHFVRVGDGPFALTGGRLFATHQADYMGIPATGRSVHIDVMDFYRFDADGRIAENWLPVDMLGLAHQMGVDLLNLIARPDGTSDAARVLSPAG